MPEPPDPGGPAGVLSRLGDRLSRTRERFSAGLADLVGLHPKLDPGFYDDLEEVLLTADVGAPAATALVDRLEDRAREARCADPLAALGLLQQVFLDSFLDASRLLDLSGRPPVILVVGVNGAGKTTTIGKLAAGLSGAGWRVVVGAADTYRAAAIDQLEVWAGRAGADLVRHAPGADPAAVAFDAVQAAAARGGVALIDTAGRLHTKQHLVEELAKIRRVIGRAHEGAPQETLLVLDASLGQNSMAQARAFHAACPLTGIVLTKLDGTARGGIVLAVETELKVPVKMVGLGETAQDLASFDAGWFCREIFSGFGVARPPS
ncbi:MAG: signal recognition particle-docking protein FtsY [Candidatus Dormibacteria bacterium]